MEKVDGFYIWKKGAAQEMPLGRWFKAKDFECQCNRAGCVTQKISCSLIEKLDKCREELGQPIIPTSGFRCGPHQAHLFSTAALETVLTSSHEKGIAADLRCKSMTRLVPLLKKHFKAMGLAATWAHVDERDDKRRTWFYKS